MKLSVKVMDVRESTETPETRAKLALEQMIANFLESIKPDPSRNLDQRQLELFDFNLEQPMDLLRLALRQGIDGYSWAALDNLNKVQLDALNAGVRIPKPITEYVHNVIWNVYGEDIPC